MYIKNQRGFSLVELMVTIGMLGGISLVTMRLLEDQSNNEAKIRSKSEIQKMIAIIKSSLSDPNNCTLNFNSYNKNTINAASTGFPLTDLKSYIPNTGTSKVLILPNKDYSQFKTDKFLLYPVAGDVKKLRLQLGFKYKKKSTDGNAANNWTTLTENLFYNVTVDASNKITDCGEVLSASNATAKQKFCLSLGSAASWDGTKCTFNQMSCPFGQVVVKLNTFGGVQCGAIKDYIKLDTLFDLSYSCLNVSGKYRIIQNGSGKLRVDCVP